MKLFYSKIRQVIWSGLFLLFFITCQKEDSSDIEFASMGDWSGTDISFQVTDNPLSIINLSFTYNGRATGNNCSFNYSSSASLSYPITISKNAFSKVSGSYEISGIFTSNIAADITIKWTGFDSNCGTNYEGTKTYHATKNK